MESLESRQLLSATVVTEYQANSGGDPTQITVGPNNDLWVTEPTANALGIFDISTKTSSSPIDLILVDGDPPGITATGTGSSATIWFTIASGNFQLGQSTSANPSVPTYYKYISGAPSTGITSTSDGAEIWVSVPSQNAIVSFNAANPLDNTPHPLSPANISAFPSGFTSQITADSNGNLWFTEPGGIGMLNASTGAVTQVTLPTSGGTQIPSAITTGPNNTIWFTEVVPGTGASAVGVISTTTDTYITEFATPTGSNPQGITLGPDGNIWFTESAAGAIGMVNVNSLTEPTLDTLGTPIPIPTTGQTGGVLSNPDPQGIIAGPTGSNSLWFADSSGAIGEVIPTTTPRLFVTSSPSSVIAGAGFPLSVEAGFSASDVDTSFNGSVTVALAANPGGATLGGNQPVSAHNGFATFSSLTLNNPGNGYTLTLSASGLTPVTTTGINVVPSSPTPTPTSPTPTPTSPTPTPTSPTPTPTSPTPTPAPTVIGESAVFTQKTNKKGKKIGKPVLSGYMITFSTAMNPGTLGTSGNYVMDTVVVTKRTKKKPSHTVLTPVGFSVVDVTSTSVTLKPSGNPFSKKAGQITVTGSSGVESAAGVFLASSVTLPISKGGKSIS